MPAAFAKPCRKSGCSATTTLRGGYCEAHKHTGWETYQQGKSRHERGYGTQWVKLRKRVLERDQGLCQICLLNGRVSEGTECDHILSKAKGGTDHIDNLQMLCRECHAKKTRQEQ